MRTFQRWAGDEHPESYDEDWRHLLWAGPLAATIGLGMHYGNKKKAAEVPDPQPKVQHVQAAETKPVPSDKRIASKKITVDDDASSGTPKQKEPQKYTQLPQVGNRQTPVPGPETEAPVERPAVKRDTAPVIKRDAGGMKSQRPIIKDTEDQQEPEQVQVVHDKTPPTAEEIKISHGQPSVKAVKVGDKVIYRSIGCAAVNLRDLNSAIKGARAVAISNLMRQMQNRGVVRFRQGADKDVKIYIKSSKNGVVCVFVVRDFDPEGISVTPERDDEGLPRESTSHRSFQSYASYRRKTHM